MPWKRPPHVDPEDYLWPYGRVGCELEDLFGELHDRFNTVPMFILDQDAFHRDVAELAREKGSREEFMARLQERRDQRLEELRDYQEIVGSFFITGYHHRLFEEPQMRAYLKLSNTASFDSLITFLASFLGPNRFGSEPRLDLFEPSSWRHSPTALLDDQPTASPSNVPHDDATHNAKNEDSSVKSTSNMTKGKRQRGMTTTAEGSPRKKRRRAEGSPAPNVIAHSSQASTPTKETQHDQVTSTKPKLSRRNRRVTKAESKGSAMRRTARGKRASAWCQQTSQLDGSASVDITGTTATRRSRRLAAQRPEFGLIS